MDSAYNSLENIKEIIREIKNTPGVYNVRHDDFLVIERREQCWRNIAEAVNLSEEELRSKWRVLRDRYVRYQRKLMLGRITRNNIRFPFYDQMKFLDPFIKRRTPRRLFQLSNKDLIKKEKTTDLSKKYEFTENDITSNDYNEEECTLMSLENVNYHHEDHEEILIEHLHDSKHDDNIVTEQYINEETVYVDPSIDEATFYGTGSNSNNNKDIESHELKYQPPNNNDNIIGSDEDDLFGKSLGLSLKKLSRLNNVRAKAEIYRVLQKYIEQEEGTII